MYSQIKFLNFKRYFCFKHKLCVANPPNLSNTCLGMRIFLQTVPNLQKKKTIKMLDKKLKIYYFTNIYCTPYF